MIVTSTPAAKPAAARPRSRRRVQFSLLSLLLFMTVACILAAWLGRPKPVTVTALLYVTPRGGTGEFDAVKKKVLALLTSRHVIQAAVDKPHVAELPMIKNQAKPVEWLQAQIRVDFAKENEIIVVQLMVPNKEADQGATLLSEIIQVYLQQATAAGQDISVQLIQPPVISR